MKILKEFTNQAKTYAAKAQPLEGVEVLELKSWNDERGFFLELERQEVTDPKNVYQKALAAFWQKIDLKKAQWSLSQVDRSDYIKGLHYHLEQTDIWFCPPPSKLKVVLFDVRSDSKTAGMTQTVILGAGHPCLLKIPAGVAHGYRTLTASANLLYCTTRTFNPVKPDEYRIAWDHAKVRKLWELKQD